MVFYLFFRIIMYFLATSRVRNSIHLPATVHRRYQRLAESRGTSLQLLLLEVRWRRARRFKRRLAWRLFWR